jgi:hypothetical protein
MVFKIHWKVFLFTIIVGICIGFLTGFVVEQPRISIPGNKYHGFPFVWRISGVETGTEIDVFKLIVDCIFWTVTVLGIILLMKILKVKVG